MVHSPLMPLTLAALSATSMLLVPRASAHSNMVNPKVKFPDGFYNGNSPYATIEGKQFASNVPENNGVERIKAAIGSSTLRDFAMKNLKLDPGMKGATKECGMSLMDGPAQEVPDTLDFPWGHPGPCEAWCDDTMIGGAADCQGTNYKITGAKEKCKGAKRLQAMFVGVHVIDWQVYTNCVPLAGGGGGGGGNSTSPVPSSSGPSTSPAPSSNGPASTSKVPSSGPVPSSSGPSSSPSSSSSAPKPNTTQSPSSKKPKPGCKRRLRSDRQ